MEKTKLHGKQTEQLSAMILFAALAVFLFWRARFGYCYQDEPFLVSLAQRFLRGDMPLVDEWHGAQNTGILLLPVYALLYRVLGGTEGILLAMRWVYCALWLCCLIFVWVRLKAFGKLRFAAIIYMALFSPLDYMTLSYTSISLMCVMATAAVTVAEVFGDRKNPVGTGLLLGALMTVSVLCYPYMVLFFIFYALMLITAAVFSRHSGCGQGKYFIEVLGMMTAVSAVCAAIYAFYILHGNDTALLADNIRQIFLDPQHAAKGPIDAVIQMLYFIGIEGIGWVYPAGMLFLTAVALLPLKNRAPLRGVLLTAGVLLFICSLVPLFAQPRYRLNEQMRNIVFLGLLAYVLTENRPKKLFRVFYGISAIYTYAAFMSSNTKITVISMGMSVAGFAAVIIILMLCRELVDRDSHFVEKAAAVMAALALLTEAAAEVRVRMSYTYYDDALPKLTETLDRGPAKGLRTCTANQKEYDETLEAFDALMGDRQRDGKTLMSANEIVSVYSDMKLDTLSTWLRGYANTEQMWQRQKKYCEINGKPYPDYLFFDAYTPYDFEIDGYEAFEKGDYTLLVKSDDSCN